MTPILGYTDEEAQAKYEYLKQFASSEGSLATFGSLLGGLDVSTYGPDEPLPLPKEKIRYIQSALENITADVPENKGAWTKRRLGEYLNFGANGPLVVGSPKTVADELESWIREADVDGFNLATVSTPSSFEDIVNLLIPELRERGLLIENQPDTTLREKYLGKGQSRLRDDHYGHQYTYNNYQGKKHGSSDYKKPRVQEA